MSLGARRRRPPTPGFVANDLWRRAGEVPSFHIAPARTGHARDLITGNLLGPYNSASPAWAVGPDGVLAAPTANAPVVDYDPATLACLGTRICGVVTNRLLNSSTSGGLSISSGTTNGPNNQVMRKAVPAAGSQSFPSVGQGVEAPLSLSSGQTVDVAIGGWFAAGSSGMAIEPRLIVDFFTSPNSNRIYAELQINTSNWTVRSKGVGPGITEVSAPVITQYSPILFPGVYRVDWVVRYTQGATTRDRTSSYVQLRDSTGSGNFTADGIGHLQFFGLQSTLSSAPQPYVPATTTAASSTADVWSITGADAARIINGAQFTVYMDGYRTFTGNFPDFPNFYAISDGSNSNTCAGYAIQNGQAITNSQIVSGGIGQTDFVSVNLGGSQSMKIVQALATNDSQFGANGTLTTADTTVTMPVGLNKISIGSSAVNANFGNFYIREFAIFRSRRPNSNLSSIMSS